MRHRDTERSSILLGLVNFAAAGPVLGGLCQFFLLAPLMLSM